MAGGDRIDPYLGFRFRLEIQGLVVGGFSEVTGLQAELETEDYREGGYNDQVHKLPKGLKHPNLVLKRGLTDSDALAKWFDEVTGGKPPPLQRKDVRIFLLDSQGQEKLSWRCIQAHPVKWASSDLKADSSTTAIETLELVHRGVKRA